MKCNCCDSVDYYGRALFVFLRKGLVLKKVQSDCMDLLIWFKAKEVPVKAQPWTRAEISGNNFHLGTKVVPVMISSC